MLTCPNCRRESPDDFAFCPVCGASLTPDPPGRETRKIVTVIFCDLIGSTALGERLDPESLRDVQSRYFEAMRTAIERHGGTVEKYIGDAVMAVFGIPQLHEDDALRAVRAAVDMREAVGVLNGELERNWGVTIATRTGVNTGEVVAGDPLTGQVMVTGDAVNVAARLEEVATSGQILIGEVTQHLARDAIVSESLGSLLVRGKKQAFEVHRLLDVLPAAAGHRRRFDLPIVGRANELAQMRREFDGVVSNSVCRLLTVLGSAGVGKSRMVREFLVDVQTSATVLRGRCPAYGTGVTYRPVKEAMNEITDPPSADWVEEITKSAGGEEAKRIIEQVSAAFGQAPRAGSHDEIRWALRRVLEIRAREFPVVLVFDDFQWADPTLVDLIHHIADESMGSPLLLICIGRTESENVHSAWSAAKGNASVLSLEPLPDADCELILSNLLDGGDIDDLVRKQIIEAAAGNPLFAEEMLSLVIEQGQLVEHEGGWGSPGGPRRISVPPTIAALIATRLDGLPRAERAVLEGASVVGVTFEPDAVEVVCDLATSVTSTLDALIAREFIEASEPDHDRGSFAFRHALIRDAAYTGMGKARRAEMHVRLADWLTSGERLIGESAELIGYHLEQAFAYRAELGSLGDEGKALGTRAAAQLWTAGRIALTGRGDLPAAIALFERAFVMTPYEDPMYIEMRLDHAQALVGLGRLEPAVSMIGDTLARAKELKERRLLARTEVRRMLIQDIITTPGWTNEASAVAERAIRVLERFEDDRGLAEAYVLLASVRWSECRASLTEVALQRAVALYRTAGDRAAELEQVAWIGATAILGPTPTDEAIGRVQRALDDVAGSPRAEASLMTGLAHLVAMRGDFDASRTLSLDAETILDELGDRARSASLAQTPIWVELAAGNAEGAEAKARAAYELLDDLGARGAQGVVGALLARALLELSRFEEAASIAAAIEEVRPDDVRTRLTCGAVRARALANLGEVGTGESKARAIVQLAKQTDFINEEGDARLDLAEILDIAGRPELAAKAVQGSLSCYRRKGNLVSVGRAQEVLSRLGNP